MFETAHRGAKLAALIAASVVVLGGAAAAAGALPSPIQGAAHDALGAAGINVPGNDDAGSGTVDDVSAADDTTTTTVDTTTTTSAVVPDSPTSEPATTEAKGPDPTGPAKFGLCTAFAAGHGATNGGKANSTAFQALANAASTAGETVTEFCAGATPGGRVASDVTPAPSTTSATTSATLPATGPAHPGASATHVPDTRAHGNPHKP
jgi:hypothetical protein